MGIATNMVAKKELSDQKNDLVGVSTNSNGEQNHNKAGHYKNGNPKTVEVSEKLTISANCLKTFVQNLEQLRPVKKPPYVPQPSKKNTKSDKREKRKSKSPKSRRQKVNNEGSDENEGHKRWKV